MKRDFKYLESDCGAGPNSLRFGSLDLSLYQNNTKTLKNINLK